jgi:hypothetical protein
MPRRRKKSSVANNTSDPRFFTKNGERRSHVIDRIEAQERGKVRLKYSTGGTVITKPWRKKGNGPVADIELVPPPFLRRDIRDQNFGDSSRKLRRKPDGSTDRPFTKPPSGSVRARRRVHNGIAKASRRANR